MKKFQNEREQKSSKNNLKVKRKYLENPKLLLQIFLVAHTFANSSKKKNLLLSTEVSAHCGKLGIFLSLRFYVKSNLLNFQTNTYMYKQVRNEIFVVKLVSRKK